MRELNNRLTRLIFLDIYRFCRKRIILNVFYRGETTNVYTDIGKNVDTKVLRIVVPVRDAIHAKIYE